MRDQTTEEVLSGIVVVPLKQDFLLYINISSLRSRSSFYKHEKLQRIGLDKGSEISWKMTCDSRGEQHLPVEEARTRPTVSTIMASSSDVPCPPRQRKSGLATVSVTPPKEGEASDMDHVNNNSVPNGIILENVNEQRRLSIPGLMHLRRMSDETFHRTLDRVRQLTADDQEAHGPQRLRKISLELEAMHLQRPPGHVKRKSVSCSQQDNIRMFKASEHEENEAPSLSTRSDFTTPAFNNA